MEGLPQPVRQRDWVLDHAQLQAPLVAAPRCTAAHVRHPRLSTRPATPSRQRFVCGERFTEADLRLFPTVVRFDAVYVTLFKCCKRRVADYPHLQASWAGFGRCLGCWVSCIPSTSPGALVAVDFLASPSE